MNIMVKQNVLVKNPTGLHARPAAQLVDLCKRFKSDIYIELNGKRCNGKSIFSVLHCCVKMGDNITLIADGEDEIAALEQTVDFIRRLEE
jgi:phosphocarrier protein HPr